MNGRSYTKLFLLAGVAFAGIAVVGITQSAQDATELKRKAEAADVVLITEKYQPAYDLKRYELSAADLAAAPLVITPAFVDVLAGYRAPAPVPGRSVVPTIRGPTTALLQPRSSPSAPG